MSATVIDFAARQSAQSPPQFDADQACLARLCSAAAFKALPFVTLKKKEDRKGGYNDAETYWNDVPTDDACADYKRGIAYAKMAVAAIKADRGSKRALELTFEHIFLDAVRRRNTGGKYSRSMPPAASAFLNEIAEIINAMASSVRP